MMAEERDPPLFTDVEITENSDFTELEDDEAAEELFVSAVSRSESSEGFFPGSNGPRAQQIVLDDEPDDLFPEVTEEVSLDSPEHEPILSDGPSPAITPITPIILQEDDDELENRDTLEIQICVSDPEKVGDGMNAYMVYKVTTKSTLSIFSRAEVSVKRRFSDFLGLHSKLASKYLHIGYIVPPAPEKSIVGMTKVKVGKEDLSYLMRTVKHPALLKDPDVLLFLESSELPRAVSTQALSGAGILRMVNRAAHAVNRMTIKMNEADAWFEEKQQQFENLEVLMRKLHASVESLVCHRKELCVSAAWFSKSVAMLGNAEEHTALSRALSQLAEVEEKMETLHQDQATADFCIFSELLGDYVRLVSAVRGVFEQRMKTWAKWQDAQVMLHRKREAEAKLQYANKPDKLQQAKEEIKEWETKVQQGERDFELISKNIRREVSRFEKQRVKDFKVVIVRYMESLVHTQQQLIKYWEAFLPEAKAIA
ncbi:hypothetical protein DNTS_004404 [Danionella cerebrum]|uniref:Sorting nexin-2 n=1 Tax=Danionella cerebrum TaxID=2873325 RepID=A0A553NHC2_9TELE|nr:hypothetical protein DNTS_004404 [Danionella translucida]